MRAMKDSGIEWIGEIPAEWELSKISEIYEERNTKVSDTDYAPLSVTKKGIIPQLESAAKTDNGDNRKLICKNDFVINSRSDRRGSCGISEYDGSCSLINTVLKPRKHMHNAYYNFVFHSELFADEFYAWGNGIVDDLWSTKWSSMKHIYIPAPNINEQTAIASYLDKKCSNIDAIITKNEQIIEKLKEYKSSLISETVTKGLNPDVEMKDSGVEWIGKIPAEWEAIKLKYVAFLKGRIGWQGLKSTEYQEEGAYLITGTDFDNGSINWENCVHITEQRYNEDMLLHVKEGDLLITKDGTIGKLAIISDCPEQVTLNSGVMYIRELQEHKYINKFLYYVFLSNVFWNWYTASQRGNSTIKHLYQEQFYDFSFPFPPLPEQNAIASYLDEKCSIIDTNIKNRELIIQKLAEYKKSLIYEVVTGKKEII